MSAYRWSREQCFRLIIFKHLREAALFQGSLSEKHKGNNMVVEYEIAKLKIRFITDFDIFQNGFSPLFVSSFEKSDVDINIALGDINVDDVPLYSDEFVEVLKNKDKYTVIYFTVDKGKKNNYFSVCGNNCILSRDCNDPLKDMFHFWGRIDLPHILISHRRLMLHCSYIISNGKAILFCGKSGIGKSTQAELWKNFAGAEIINGDKAVVYSENGKLYAASLPIAGTSNICSNKTAEVKAIVILSQNTKNEAEEVSTSEKISLLASNCLFDVWRDGEIIDVIELCSEFFQLAEVIKYGCLPDNSAVEELKKVIE